MGMVPSNRLGVQTKQRVSNGGSLEAARSIFFSRCCMLLPLLQVCNAHQSLPGVSRGGFLVFIRRPQDQWVGKRAQGTAPVSWEPRCMESGNHASVPFSRIQGDTEISGPGLTPHSCRQWKMCTRTQGLAFPRQVSGDLSPSVLDRGVSQDHDFQS